MRVPGFSENNLMARTVRLVHPIGVWNTMPVCPAAKLIFIPLSRSHNKQSDILHQCKLTISRRKLNRIKLTISWHIIRLAFFASRNLIQEMALTECRSREVMQILFFAPP